MRVAEALKSAQFLLDGEGKQTAVFLNIEGWNAIMNWIEDITDTQIALQALSDLQKKGGRPETAGWLAWDEISEEWDGCRISDHIEQASTKFWSNLSLNGHSSVRPVHDIDELLGPEPPEEEESADEFIADIRQWRKEDK